LLHYPIIYHQQANRHVVFPPGGWLRKDHGMMQPTLSLSLSLPPSLSLSLDFIGAKDDKRWW